MKIKITNCLMLLLSLSVVANVAQAAGKPVELKQCDSTSKSNLSYESEDLKITFIQGDIAKLAWDGLAEEVVTPEAGTFGGITVYNAEAKLSESIKCWRYQPSKIINGVDSGASDCMAYSCNVIERN